MIERLAIPAWKTPTRTLDDWRARFEALGHPSAIDRGAEEAWLLVDSAGLRALAVIESEALGALHVEIIADDPAPALALLDAAAEGLGWEVHDEDDGEED